MKAFLKMKHWQIFLLVFGLPAAIIFFPFILMYYGKSGEWFFWSILASIVLMTTFWCWYQYAVVHELRKKLPAGENINMMLYGICVIAPVVLLFLFLFFLGSFIFKVSRVGFDENLDPISLSWILLILPLMTIAFGAGIYVIIIMSRVIVAVEKQRPVTVGDYIVEFVLLWFWYIGVWVLQPRINALIADNTRNYPPPLPDYLIPPTPTGRSMPPPIISNP